MSLAELLAGHAADSDLKPGKDGGIVVRGLAIDSRDVREGDAFVALKGAREHGITFAPMALARGAVAVLAERPEEAAASAPASLGEKAGIRHSGFGITRFRIPNPESRLARKYMQSPASD